ncbi:glycoside hydrolase family 3 N-terminal domain-containing protein [Microbacterium sp. A196]|uniref:glycoside hydrolase family 3 N-terminal domain-containing protein n=1 Tax=Microbacterium sp. A196 TaxID=3457320 RepID=UPI003FD529F6
MDELRSIHLPPFAAAIEAGAKTMMSAHIRVPALGDAVATINSTTLAMARELGFEGVLITDAVDMAAISGTLGSGPGAVAALAAGADLICIGNPATNEQVNGMNTDQREFLEPLHAVYDALESGALPVARVEEAAARIAELAEWRRRQPAAVARPEPFDGAPLAERAAIVIGDVRLPGDAAVMIDARTKRNIAVGDAADFFTLALREHMPADRISLGGLSEADAAERALAVIAERADDAVLIVNQPQSSAFEASVLDAVLAVRPDTIVIYAGWPADGAPAARRALLTYGASRATAQHAARVLRGRS